VGGDGKSPSELLEHAGGQNGNKRQGLLDN